LGEEACEEFGSALDSFAPVARDGDNVLSVALVYHPQARWDLEVFGQKIPGHARARG
jgi:nitrate reductase NapAB chaperone NapD